MQFIIFLVLFILYETFAKIDNCDCLKKEFYSGPSRNLLVHISMDIIAGGITLYGKIGAYVMFGTGIFSKSFV